MSHCFTLLVGSLRLSAARLKSACSGVTALMCPVSQESSFWDVWREDFRWQELPKNSLLWQVQQELSLCWVLWQDGKGCGPSREGSHTPLWGIGCTPILIVSSIGELLGIAHGLGLRLVAASVPHGCWVWPLRASGVWSCAVNRNQLLLWKRTLFWGFVHPDVVKHSYLKAIYEFYVSLYEKCFMSFYDQTCVCFIASCSRKSPVSCGEPTNLGEVKGLLETPEFNFIFRCCSFPQEKEIQVHETSRLGKGPRKYQGWSALSTHRLFGNWLQLQGLNLGLGPNSP